MKAEIILNHDYIIGEPDGMLFGSFVEHIGRSVYTGIYEFEGGVLNTLWDDCAVSFDELLQKLDEFAVNRNKRIIFIGDGIPVYREKIAAYFTDEKAYEFAPASINRQRAASVAALGSIYYSEGRTERAEEHLPEYMRLSQAERELKEKEQHG